MKWNARGEWIRPCADNNLKINFFNTQQVSKVCDNSNRHPWHLGSWASTRSELALGNGTWASTGCVLELKGYEGKEDLEDEIIFQIAHREFSKCSSRFQYECNL